MSLSEEQTKKRHFAAYFCLRYKKEKRVTLQEAYDFIEEWMRKTYGEPAFTSFNALKIYLHRHDLSRCETFNGKNESDSPIFEVPVALAGGGNSARGAGQRGSLTHRGLSVDDTADDFFLMDVLEVPIRISNRGRPNSCDLDDTRRTIEEEDMAYYQRLVCLPTVCPCCGAKDQVYKLVGYHQHKNLSMQEVVAQILRQVRGARKEARETFSAEVQSDQ